MVELPESAKRYFWDVDSDKLNISKRPRFVIERLLEYGDFPDLKWMFQNYRKETIVEVLKQ